MAVSSRRIPIYTYFKDDSIYQTNQLKYLGILLLRTFFQFLNPDTFLLYQHDQSNIDLTCRYNFDYHIVLLP